MSLALSLATLFGKPAAITSCIREGIQTKMVIAKEVANRCRCSRKQAIQVLEKHTGDDPTSHRWHYEVRARGAQFFVLNTPPNHGDKLLGHSQIKTTTRYSHLADETLFSAVDVAARVVDASWQAPGAAQA